MNDSLERRYWDLFYSYGSDGEPLVDYTKSLITERLSDLGGFLRADAALFLLANVDYMLIRPYGSEAWKGYVTNPTDAPPLFTDDEMRHKLRSVIDIIFDDLLSKREQPDFIPVSSHAVLLSIHDAWDVISPLFWWP
jgi:hypothetical protein